MGLPDIPGDQNDPDYQCDNLAWQNPELSFGDICSATGLATETVTKRLGELVTEGRLAKRREGKKQFYRPLSLQSCKEPLVIRGPRKKLQVQRLIRMGLDPTSIKSRAGRPTHFPRFDVELGKVSFGKDEDEDLEMIFVNFLRPP